MPFDFKKEPLYRAGRQPQIVQVPPCSYLAVRGQGDPNQVQGSYQQAVSILYAVAYTLKMSPRNGHFIAGFFDYVVPPLEGFWWQEAAEISLRDKSAFHWISVLRLPDFIRREDFEWAVRTAERKKKLDCSPAEFLRVEEGLCAASAHRQLRQRAGFHRLDERLCQRAGLSDRPEPHPPSPRDLPFGCPQGGSGEKTDHHSPADPVE